MNFWEVEALKRWSSLLASFTTEALDQSYYMFITNYLGYHIAVSVSDWVCFGELKNKKEGEPKNLLKLFVFHVTTK